MKKRIASLLLICAGTMVAKAQLSFDGQYIARTEVRNGFKKLINEETEPAAFIEHRARLNAAWKKDKIGFKMSIQDVRIWGETGQINKSDNLLSTHEAYGDYYASANSTFRIGRQEVFYDDHRFIGTLDWAMQGRSFDAVRYIYKNDTGTQFDLMASWNQSGYGDGNPEPTKLTDNYYSVINGGGGRIFNLTLPKNQLVAYYKKTLKSGDISVMVDNELYNTNDSTKYSNYTLGFTGNYKMGKLKMGGQAFYTGGDAGMSYLNKEYVKVDASGYMASAYVQHTGWMGQPLLGVDYLSGDDASTTDKVEGWAPKYGTNHKFYGFMDYFYVGNGHGGVDAQSAGLFDLYLKTTFAFGEKTKLLGHLHYFSAPEERVYASTGEKYDGYLGTEVDLVLSRAITPEFNLQLGYSQMFGASDTMKLLKTGNPNQKIQGTQCWAWLMVSFTPKFL